MIKKNAAVLLVFFACINFLLAGDSTVTKDFRKISQKAFKPGEKLTFEISYGFVNAGEAVMEIDKNYQTINGRKCYDIRFYVNSSSSFEWVYKVRDFYRTYVDAEGLFPWRFEQHIKEGNYQRDFEAIFDQQNLKAKTYTGDKDPKKFEGEFDIPEYTQDAMSAFYYARTFDYGKMKEGDKISLQNFYKDKTYPLDVRYLGKETIEVPAGEFRCIKVEPLVQEGGLFKSEGSIVVWMTDDERRMPVKVKTKVIIGSIDADLSEYSGLAGPLKSKK
ncbi:MAG: DUF3108 domain-containing protein [Ignavibacteria bacterium]|jgi:hypothetical protein|nr:DUF3108 domain-containing protein [Ignavibacteria bacterium]MBK7444575.1 DUF3108 domain-containing protein [Ignavibacteria bacterium]MBK8382274.1 DUF3108 domain-containing protein [Ignavibacteria bacterium]MBK9403563.1 DUF3108 domain-containing protein [Ignavibacteria bacterium]MBL0107116.1 DUF3108 domain-containing protein [Ignavibacteria bacterium]